MTSPEPKLCAQVVGDDIIVTLPGSHYSVTYYSNRFNRLPCLVIELHSPCKPQIVLILPTKRCR